MVYQLMYKDETIIEFNSENMTDYVILSEKYLPIGIQNGMTLEKWLRQRRADKTRISVRKLFATLKMNFGDDAYVSQFRKPTDFWWVRQKEGNETFDRPIEDLHLIALNLEAIIPKSPQNYEVANIGSYDKAWKEGHLVKSGNINEIFSEMLYAKISAYYMPSAIYELTKINNQLFISTPNFISQADGEYLVLADEWTGTGAEEEFEDWFMRFKQILTAKEIDGLKIMHFLDVVMNNFDRHCQNFGFIYRENNKRLLAPNFDFNLSIIGYNGLKNLGKNELPIKTYFDLFDEVPEPVKRMPTLEELQQEISIICEILEIGDEYLAVAEWIVNRWERLI